MGGSSRRVSRGFSRRQANGLTVLVAVLFSLILCELLVRMFDMAPPIHRLRVDQRDSAYQRSENPILGYDLKPNYRSDQPGFHSNYAYTNAHGFRDLERETQKKPGMDRVIVLGDSVVLGHGLGDLNHTISRQLDELSGPTVEALNMSVGGYCTQAEADLFETRGVQFSPDVLVVVFVENDWDDVNGHTAWVGTDQSRPAWAEGLFLHSDLFRFLSLRLDWFGFRTGAGPNRRLVENMEAIGGDNVTQGLRRFARLAKEQGMHVLVAIWPRFTETNIVEVERGEIRTDDAVLSVESTAKNVGLPTLRLSKAFRADWRARGRSPAPAALYSQPDGMHPTAEGARVAARALLAELTGRGWLPSKNQ